LGHPYGGEAYLEEAENLHKFFAESVYSASVELAQEKGSFPALDIEQYMKSAFIERLNPSLQSAIAKHGIRNSHLISYAPTGTISNCADNVSGGIEPVFAHEYKRRVRTEDGDKVETVQDYGVKFFGVYGVKSSDLTPLQHLKVQEAAQYWCDSAVSKTVNVDKSCSWDNFKDIYMKAWEMGIKGVTTFNADGKRMALLTDTAKEDTSGPKACFIDPATGEKECS
jgi:ribonucleoside-diphosphate reductase alpha chain